MIFFFFNDTATTEIYTLSLHDALPICVVELVGQGQFSADDAQHALEFRGQDLQALVDRKSTRLNSSHLVISYAVFCLKKKKKNAFDLRLADTWWNRDPSVVQSHLLLIR